MLEEKNLFQNRPRSFRGGALPLPLVLVLASDGAEL
jgi:hypothetical protein